MLFYISVAQCNAQFVDSVGLNCSKAWIMNTIDFDGEKYYSYYVQFIFTNHSQTKKTFITSDSWRKNFINNQAWYENLIIDVYSDKNQAKNENLFEAIAKSDNYIINEIGQNKSNIMSVINPHSKFVKTFNVLIPSKYILLGKKKIKFDFIWVTGEDYKAKKFDSLIKLEIQRVNTSYKPKENEINQKGFIFRLINMHYKFELILKEKIQLRKDILTCEMDLP